MDIKRPFFVSGGCFEAELCPVCGPVILDQNCGFSVRDGCDARLEFLSVRSNCCQQISFLKVSGIYICRHFPVHGDHRECSVVLHAGDDAVPFMSVHDLDSPVDSCGYHGGDCVEGGVLQLFVELVEPALHILESSEHARQLHGGDGLPFLKLLPLADHNLLDLCPGGQSEFFRLCVSKPSFSGDGRRHIALLRDDRNRLVQFVLRDHLVYPAAPGSDSDDYRNRYEQNDRDRYDHGFTSSLFPVPADRLEKPAVGPVRKLPGAVSVFLFFFHERPQTVLFKLTRFMITPYYRFVNVCQHC